MTKKRSARHEDCAPESARRSDPSGRDRAISPAHAFLISWPPKRSFSRQKSDQNPAKSDHFRECEFFSYSPSTAYNFSPSRRSDSPVGTAQTRPSQSCSVRSYTATSVSSVPSCWIPGRRSKLNKTERFRRELPDVYCTAALRGFASSLFNPKSNKTERSQNLRKTDHVVPSTYDDNAPSRSIFNSRLVILSSFDIRAFGIQPRCRGRLKMRSFEYVLSTKGGGGCLILAAPPAAKPAAAPTWLNRQFLPLFLTYTPL